jgi:hypothetical protein
MPMRIFLLSLALLTLITGCETSTEESQFGSGADPLIGNLVAYKKVVSERHGIVGYIKVFEFKTEEFGEAYHLYRVLDIDFVERGLLYPRGEGLKFNDVAPEIAAVTGVTREEIELGPQPLDLNLSKILEVGLPLKVLPAGPDDLKRPGTE